MENSNIGRVIGSGVYDEKLIAWEFRSQELNFEGFESYYLQPDGSYLMHVEYVTSDQFRTQIEGRLWLPPNQKKEKVKGTMMTFSSFSSIYPSWNGGIFMTLIHKHTIILFHIVCEHLIKHLYILHQINFCDNVSNKEPTIIKMKST